MKLLRSLLLLLLLLPAGTLFAQGQKDPSQSGDQPMVRFPLIQLKVNLLAPAFSNYDFEGEALVSERWSVSARIGSTRSFEDLRRIGEYRCLFDQGMGLALGARYNFLPQGIGQGLGLKATVFHSRHHERDWNCGSPPRPLRKGSDTGLGLHLSWQRRLRGALFIEPFAGINAALSQYTTNAASPTLQRKLDWQIPVGLMLGLGF